MRRLRLWLRRLSQVVAKTRLGIGAESRALLEVLNSTLSGLRAVDRKAMQRGMERRPRRDLSAMC